MVKHTWFTGFDYFYQRFGVAKADTAYLDYLRFQIVGCQLFLYSV